MLNFTKLFPVRIVFPRVDGQTDRHHGAHIRFAQLLCDGA